MQTRRHASRAKSRQNKSYKANATPPRRRGGFARVGPRALLLGRRAERDALVYQRIETARRQVRLPLDADSKWSPRDVAAAIADEVGRNEQKAYIDV